LSQASAVELIFLLNVDDFALAQFLALTPNSNELPTAA
jgi:hypothetical protein